MRSKEEAHDYRYFPEPDLPPFVFTADFMQTVDARICELPLERKTRLAETYRLQPDLAEFIIDEKDRADWFEAAAELGTDPYACASWMKGDISRVLAKNKLGFSRNPLTPERFSILLRAIDDFGITVQQAKQVLEAVVESDLDPLTVIQEEGLDQIAEQNREQLASIVKDIVHDNPDAAQQIRDGSSKAVGFLMGQVMRVTHGSADPGAARELIMKFIRKTASET